MEFPGGVDQPPVPADQLENALRLMQGDEAVGRTVVLVESALLFRVGQKCFEPPRRILRQKRIVQHLARTAGHRRSHDRDIRVTRPDVAPENRPGGPFKRRGDLSGQAVSEPGSRCSLSIWQSAAPMKSAQFQSGGAIIGTGSSQFHGQMPKAGSYGSVT